jgi:hypothetical protein
MNKNIINTGDVIIENCASQFKYVSREGIKN